MSDENSAGHSSEPGPIAEPSRDQPAGQAQAQGLTRRNIPQRSTGWAKRSADALYAAKLTPNSISVISVLFALVGAVALALSGIAFPTSLTAQAITDGPTGPDQFSPWFSLAGARWWLLLIAAVCIPMRLLCNMLDGMLAVEKGMQSATGDLFNELPDRIADVLLLVGAGIAAIGIWRFGGIDWGITLGWLAAVLAVLTAYVRTLGAANGVGNFFGGPMAKPPRMWILTAASLIAMAEPALALPRGTVITIALAVISVGALITVIVRLRKITVALRLRQDTAKPDANDVPGANGLPGADGLPGANGVTGSNRETTS
ncbi:CDP-alcohol phosphatidyltransferase family protein [Gulosibacter chungangensis]|uniref:CDP-alcohol phosphatidyltransferase family protein n=1 Tax=Gulosibacter chungangensis TaxID=979746 RepID=A0A7J5BCT2_9MICO|nr:CDP-alcohol phosphatidyltransferase family protein [Gulosibacter chungangensis]KAB1643419.1 CDP-alcohol phosphatidyltransferase family protein [Gulosibacter chungangensis]